MPNNLGELIEVQRKKLGLQQKTSSQDGWYN